jgi:hypothetical protein
MHFKSTFASIAQLILIAVMPASEAWAGDIRISDDPMKGYTKISMDIGDGKLLRSYVKPNSTFSVQLYVVTTYPGENRRYKSANVKWIDGKLISVQVSNVDSDVSCSGYSRTCYWTDQMILEISSGSWQKLMVWAKSSQGQSSSIPIQFQSRIEGTDLMVYLSAEDIRQFSDGIYSVYKRTN